MRFDYRLVLASLMVWLVGLLLGAQAQSANMMYAGKWSGVTKSQNSGFPGPGEGPTTPYGGTSPTVSTPSGCWGLSTPAFGAGGMVNAYGTLTGTAPNGTAPLTSGIVGRPGCDLRSMGMRPGPRLPSFPYNGANVGIWGIGVANVTTTGSAPRAFTIPSGVFTAGPASYSQVYPPPGYVQWAAGGTQRGGAGNFGPGLGIASSTINWTAPTTRTGTYGTRPLNAKLRYTPGAANFGGTMQLLGPARFFAMLSTIGGSYQSFAEYNTGLYYCVGGGSFAGTCNGNVVIGYRTTQSATPTTRFTVSGARLYGFPWGTGTLTATQKISGIPVSFFTTKGSDNRTSGGLGSIKMVTPYFASYLDTSYGWSGEYELVFNFTPEPRRGVMLAVGVLLLAGLAQLRLRRR